MNIIKEELNIIIKNKFLCFMYFAIPIIVCVFVYSTFKKEIITNLPIGLIDLDKTKLSRNIAFNINSSPTLNIINQYDDISHAKNDSSNKKIYALVIIPYNLQKDVTVNKMPNCTLYILPN